MVTLAVWVGILVGSRQVSAGQIVSLEPGDVVLSVNGQMLEKGGDLAAAVRRSPDLMRLTVIDSRTDRLRALQTRLRSRNAARRFGVSTEDRGGRGVTITDVQPGSPASHCEPDSEFALAQVVVRLILARSEQGHDQIGEGTILVYQWPTEKVGENGAPKFVWRYRAGQLESTGDDVWRDAFGTDRSKWPPNTICFAIAATPPQRMVVSVSTFHDGGIAEDSRGGNAAHWTLQKQSGKRAVIEEQDLAVWD